MPTLIQYRTDLTFAEDGEPAPGWYFILEDGFPVGPFDTEEEALIQSVRGLTRN